MPVALFFHLQPPSIYDVGREGTPLTSFSLRNLLDT